MKTFLVVLAVLALLDFLALGGLVVLVWVVRRKQRAEGEAVGEVGELVGCLALVGVGIALTYGVVWLLVQ